MKFLLLSAVLYAPGTALYFWARGERNKRFFTGLEWIVFTARSSVVSSAFMVW